MNPSDHPMAQFHRLRGAPHWHTARALWCPAGRFSLYAPPSALPVASDRAEMEAALRLSGKLVAVCVTTRPTGLAASAFILRDKGYARSSLQRQFRQHVARAARHGHVRQLSWPELELSGVEINRGRRQRGREIHSGFHHPAEWATYCRAAQQTPGLEAWGVFCHGQLAAFMVTLTWNGTCHGLHMHWGGACADQRPTHLLYFEVARAIMARPQVDAFSVGRQTLPANPGLDRFKAHAGFTPEPVSLAVVSHPRWRPLLESPAIELLQPARRLAQPFVNLALLQAARQVSLRGLF